MLVRKSLSSPVLASILALAWVMSPVLRADGPKPKPIDFYGKKVTVLEMFGQSRFGDCSPGRVDGSRLYHAAGVVVDRSRKPNPIYLIDAGNSRVLGFKSIDSKKADLVFGQPDEFSGAPNGDCNTGEFAKPRRDSLCLMCVPSNTNLAEQWMFHHIDVDAEGNLYVADFMNNRVLMYRAPFSSDKTGGKGDTLPDLVLGQDDYTSNGINRGKGRGKPDAKSLYISFGGFDHVASRGVSVDKDANVWVADTFNFRVVRFPMGKTEADLVLGQPDFTTAQGSPGLAKAPMDRMCTPTIARLHPDTGELYVVDEHPGGFPGRIMVFKPPFKNGMKADHLLEPKVPRAGDFKDGYRLTHATGLVFNPVKTDDWTDPDKKTHRYKDGVVWVNDGMKRTMLLDGEGNVLVTVAATDVSRQGCQWGDYGQGGQDPAEPFNLGWPGGMIGFDSDNNIYIADGHFHRVARFALPYRYRKVGGKVVLPNANGGLCPGVLPNTIGPAHVQADPVGVFAYKGQLILRDHQRYMVWSDYLSKKVGSPADLFIGQKNGTSTSERNHIMGRAMHALDHKDRLWATGEHGRLMVYQLPMKAGAKPLRELVPFHWSDDPDKEVDYRAGQAIAFESATKSLWVFDHPHHRLLRVRVPDDVTGKLLVDAVIGQKNKTDGALNRGMKKPDAASFGDVNDVKFDRQGNLFVVDNTYELHHNGRIIAFLAEDLQKIKTMFPETEAKRVYVASSFDEPVHQRKLPKVQSPHSPVCLAFNSRNEMVVGNDGYFSDARTRNVNQLYLYRKPLEKATPDAVIELPLGAPGEMVFDAEDNLIVQDHPYNKVWVINYDRDPVWLRGLK